MNTQSCSEESLLRDSQSTPLSHTPGPWFADWGDGVTGPRASFAPYMPTGEDAFDRIPIRAGAFPVAWVISHNEPREQLHTDARLIAAAPDLLEALREAELLMRRMVENGSLLSTDTAWRGAIAAIVKAVGP